MNAGEPLGGVWREVMARDSGGVPDERKKNNKARAQTTRPRGATTTSVQPAIP